MRIIFVIWSLFLAACGRQDYPDTALQSSLTKQEAITRAKALQDLGLIDSWASIAPTGSMEPILNENSIALYKTFPWYSLTRNQAVRIHYPDGRHRLHRLYEFHGDCWTTFGQANGRLDKLVLTQANYAGTLIGIIYYHEK